MHVEITLPANPSFIDILALGHAWTLAEIEAAGHVGAYAAARRQAEGVAGQEPPAGRTGLRA